MNLKQIAPLIEKEHEQAYLLNLWHPMMKQWGITKNDAKDEHDFKRFISKMMEIERACVEEGDKRPIVFMRKDFLECKVIIYKKNKEKWIYFLQPFGYDGNWEIFNVSREKTKNRQKER